MEVFQLFVQ